MAVYIPGSTGNPPKVSFILIEDTWYSSLFVTVVECQHSLYRRF
jgi:hypothetical protein